MSPILRSELLGIAAEGLVCIPGCAPLSVARARQVIIVRRMNLEVATETLFLNPTEANSESYRRLDALYNEARLGFRLATGRVVS